MRCFDQHHQLNGYEFEQTLRDCGGQDPGKLQSMVLQREEQDSVTNQKKKLYIYLTKVN